jgi:hypothetical protein
MTDTKLLDTLELIPEGTRIPGLNRGTEYRFAAIGVYQSRGKAPAFDGEKIVTLESSKRRPAKIHLLVSVLATHLADGKKHLRYGRTPPSVVLKYRGIDAPRPPNLSDYTSHYKSMALFLCNNCPSLCGEPTERSQR